MLKNLTENINSIADEISTRVAWNDALEWHITCAEETEKMPFREFFSDAEKLEDLFLENAVDPGQLKTIECDFSVSDPGKLLNFIDYRKDNPDPRFREFDHELVDLAILSQYLEIKNYAEATDEPKKILDRLPQSIIDNLHCASLNEKRECLDKISDIRNKIISSDQNIDNLDQSEITIDLGFRVDLNETQANLNLSIYDGESMFPTYTDPICSFPKELLFSNEFANVLEQALDKNLKPLKNESCVQAAPAM